MTILKTPTGYKTLMYYVIRLTEYIVKLHASSNFQKTA